MRTGSHGTNTRKPCAILLVVGFHLDSILSDYDVAYGARKMARGFQPAVLMVAEKPSIAKSVAGILSNGHCSTNQSHVCKKCPVHEFTGQFLGSSARIKVTSVLGHVLKVEFDKGLPKLDAS